MKISEMFDYCLANEDIFMGHYIHHALQSQKVTLDDDIRKLDSAELNMDHVHESIKNNSLGFGRVKVIAIRENDKTFHFVFAETVPEAINEFETEYGIKPLSCTIMSLDKEVGFPPNRFTTFRELRNEHKMFPVIFAHMNL